MSTALFSHTPQRANFFQMNARELDETQLRAAENFFHEQIPLTRTMGLRVLPDSTHGFAIEAPVTQNRNHLQTAFGGSINAVATLAGYGFLWLQLRESAAEVVVAESAIRFLRPVRETIRAVCRAPETAELAKFHEGLRAQKKAKMRLQVRVEENGNVAAEFHGTFVALIS